MAPGLDATSTVRCVAEPAFERELGIKLCISDDGATRQMTTATNLQDGAGPVPQAVEQQTGRRPAVPGVFPVLIIFVPQGIGRFRWSSHHPVHPRGVVP
jgi:hypothetical protein